MPLKLGTSSVALRLGATEVDDVYIGSLLGTTTVPGVPTITSAQESLTPFGSVFVNWNAPTDDGGKAITSYRIYIDSVLQPAQGYIVDAFPNASPPGAWTVEITEDGSPLDENLIEISAVNEVGEGPKASVTLNPAP